MSLADKYNIDLSSAAAGATRQPQWERPPARDAAAIIRDSDNPHHVPRPWMYGLCVCCSKCDSMSEAWCCGYCQLSRQYNQLYNLQPSIHWVLCGCTLILDHMFAKVASWLLLWSLRSDLRRRYGIAGGPVSDCLVTYFCAPCALQQHFLEMTAVGACPGGLCLDSSPELTTMMV